MQFNEKEQCELQNLIKRNRRTSVCPNSVAVGEELTEFFGETSNKDTALIESELIAQVKTSEGATVGDVVKICSDINRCKTRFVCNYCNEVFQWKSLFLAHITSHKSVQYECNACNKIFQDKSLFTQHQVITKHSGMGVVEEFRKAKTSNESIRNEAVSTIGDFSNANTVHAFNQTATEATHNNKCLIADMDLEEEVYAISKFDCIKCEKSFRNASAVKRHQQVHSLERPFKCQICPASFKVPIDKINLSCKSTCYWTGQTNI